MSDTDDRRPNLSAVLPPLMRLGTALNRSVVRERAMERVGIPLDRPAMTVLVTLRLAGQPLRVGEIAARMQVVGPHVTRHLHELERRGLVRRVADPHDQRARLIELTPDGDAAAGRYLRTVLDWFADALADWSEEDRETFGRLLTRFVDDVSARMARLDDESAP
ncbi:DNA-binding transcriptional regulator, MarR family [Streptoalloteichus tenebrarius]|uniref:DNA-binding transcriptional regulator, MarR family n=1 Tax=Streptoalloteichus tenebrarius (strain ATCC 17920 / DSM 40477 / JCM 4838 / CBS 697.72 / NBRC 16177 / NCIMB 11028 / NRRL B-12390 / A12253. 1 / ISP 5477) TaxID=1933 RepID=A0ABT1HNN5_STRSD|nr:MarR family transcriptional regulator [Streptoalloteichus tenebrarius]MCP2257116.1 DNA-binding transcriptional regulator, MarR family [Streptoalloteichus tenebrarius]BFE98748.1 MarR family winged helix-turn-helix transcriptional regulator [Streptoalloteichus tenebrarius]